MRDYASTSLVNYASLIDAYIVPVLDGIGANSDRMVRQPPSGPSAQGQIALCRPPALAYVLKMSLIGQVKPGSTSEPSSVSWSVRDTTAWSGSYTSTVRVSGCTTHTRATP